MTHPSEFTLTTGDLAKRFGVNVDTIARWADQGLLPCLRTPGKFRRFSEADVERFAAELLPKAAS